MSVIPYPIQCFRDGSWITVQTDQLLPGDLVSIGTLLFGVQTIVV
jgi:cation-transporting ATPase 13A1